MKERGKECSSGAAVRTAELTVIAILPVTRDQPQPSVDETVESGADPDRTG